MLISPVVSSRSEDLIVLSAKGHMSYCLTSCQVRKKGLGHLRALENQDVLQMRLDLAQQLSVAEKKWKDRMISVLETGWGKYVGLRLNCRDVFSKFRMKLVWQSFFSAVSLTWTILSSVGEMTHLTIISQHSGVASLRRPDP